MEGRAGDVNRQVGQGTRKIGGVPLPPSSSCRITDLGRKSSQCSTNKGVIGKVAETNELDQLLRVLEPEFGLFLSDSTQSRRNKRVICKVLLSNNLAGRFLR